MTGAPRVLVFAGLDPSARAGLLADGEAVRALGARPVLCATAVAAQSSGRLVRMEPVSGRAVEAQAEAALEDGPLGAVKVGMVGSREALAALARLFAGSLAGVPVVADPVFSTSRGGSLFEGKPSDWAELMPLSALTTPNLGEAAALTGLPCGTEEEMAAAAQALAGRGARAVLLKGGHLPAAPADLLWAGGRGVWLRGERVPGRFRGTGCRLASAIAARLARGDDLEQAVRLGVGWLREWMAGEGSAGPSAPG